MFIFLVFFSLFLGLICLVKPIISLIIFSLIIIYFIKKKNKIIIVLLSIYILGIIIYFLSTVDVFKNKFYGIIIDSKENYFVLKVGFNHYLVSNKDNKYEVGDLLFIKGNLIPYSYNTYESQFDFNKYLKNKYIYKEINVSEIKVLFNVPFRIRNYVYLNIDNYSENTKLIIGKLLFNLSLSEEYSRIISSSSLFYVLSISSLHLHLINDFNKKILGIKFKEKVVDILIIISNIVLFVLSNYKISIFKVLLIEIIYFISNNYLKNKLNHQKIISLSGLIILLLVPSYSLQIGFIYSYSIPYFIYFSRNALISYKGFKRKIMFIFILYLFMIPLSIINNGYFSLFGMFMTSLLIPLIIFIFFLGILGLFIPLYRFTSLACNLFYRLLEFIGKISIDIYIGKMNIIFIITYYLLLILFLYYLENKMKKNNRYVLILLSFILIFNLLPIKNRISYEVSFINVGQGDSTLIRYHNVAILVDTGGIKDNDLALNTLIPFFKKKKIYKLDYVFLTHQDYDHIGAFDSLTKHFRVIDYNKDNYFATKVIKGINFTNLNLSESNEENDDSLVLYFTLGNDKFLLMGDASKVIEEKIIKSNIDLKINYLKVGHHGSLTSTSDEFISYIKVETAIISCASKNKYGHPNKEVIDILKKNNVNIRYTKDEGTISIIKYAF